MLVLGASLVKRLDNLGLLEFFPSFQGRSTLAIDLFTPVVFPSLHSLQRS